MPHAIVYRQCDSILDGSSDSGRHLSVSHSMASLISLLYGLKLGMTKHGQRGRWAQSTGTKKNNGPLSREETNPNQEKISKEKEHPSAVRDSSYLCCGSIGETDDCFDGNEWELWMGMILAIGLRLTSPNVCGLKSVIRNPWTPVSVTNDKGPSWSYWVDWIFCQPRCLHVFFVGCRINVKMSLL